MRAMNGSIFYPLTERIADGIKVHGMRWAVTYYSKRMSRMELRVLMRVALTHL